MVTDFYIVQRQWGPTGEWVDYRQPFDEFGDAREMLELASNQAGFGGPWRIIHRVTAVVEMVVE